MGFWPREGCPLVMDVQAVSTQTDGQLKAIGLRLLPGLVDGVRVTATVVKGGGEREFRE